MCFAACTIVGEGLVVYRAIMLVAVAMSGHCSILLSDDERRKRRKRVALSLRLVDQ